MEYKPDLGYYLMKIPPGKEAPSMLFKIFEKMELKTPKILLIS